MGEFNFKDGSFKEFLKNKESQIYIRTKNGIQETNNFKNLHRNLVSYKEQRVITDFTALLISYEDIDGLKGDYTEKLFSSLDSEKASVNNHLLFNESLELVNFDRKQITDNNEARKYYLGISNDLCVFLINPQGVHYFVKGEDVGASIFFTQDTLNSYNKKNSISDISDLFESYRHHLKDRDTYAKFFVSNSSKKSLCKHLYPASKKEDYEVFLKKNKQLLENKPEDRFREDLRMFLRRNLKTNVLTKEYILENFKRLDIFINDDFGELYLIEVKWVGVSIHANGQKIGTSYKESDINPDAIKQSIGYIKQLHEENKNIKLGYLAVFDARDSDLPDTASSFNESDLNDDLQPYKYKYKKIKDFKVLNIHPN